MLREKRQEAATRGNKMAVVAALIGAFLGYEIADVSEELLGVVVGALIGWGIAVLMLWRRRIAELEESVTELRQRMLTRETPTPPPRPSVQPAEAPRTAPVQPRESVPLDFD